MTQNARHPDQERVNQIGWQAVHIAPLPDDVREIEAEVPAEWLRPLEPDLEAQRIQMLHALSDEELAERIRQDIEDLELDVAEIMDELPASPPRTIEIERDFGR